VPRHLSAVGVPRRLDSGEPDVAVGKPRLVQSIVDRARSHDVAVFCGQAHPFERTRPFGVVAAALDLSRRSRDPRKAAIGGLLAGEGAGDIQYRVLEEIVDLVETACAERPVLLVAEDLHRAHSASLWRSCRWHGSCRSRRCSSW
jgi:hypothetical protein